MSKQLFDWYFVLIIRYARCYFTDLPFIRHFQVSYRFQTVSRFKSSKSWNTSSILMRVKSQALVQDLISGDRFGLELTKRLIGSQCPFWHICCINSQFMSHSMKSNRSCLKIVLLRLRFSANNKRPHKPTQHNVGASEPSSG